jgi:hypothetical protein
MRLAIRGRRLAAAAAVAAVLSPAAGFLSADRDTGSRRGLLPGERLPDAVLRTLSGEAVDTGEWRGRPTLLALHRKGCPACSAHAAGLRDIAPLVAGLRIVFLATDGPPAYAPPPFLSVHDPAGEFLRRVRRVAVPAVYWADGEGTVRFARVGTLPPEAELALLLRLSEKYGSSPAPPLSDRE